ncbi:MAG: hypothetical protein HGB29_02775 [Chlorobiaceae bacterium]|nr:hypothetical protein [Chlorobiaceae bacterium]NTW73768.1 hypothetical protein [Chlorobiaceae bacterium]
MTLKRALLAWLLIISAESVSGVFRRIVLVPEFGELRSHWIGVATACAIVFAVSWRYARPPVEAHFGRALGTGLIWVVLTLMFEFGLGLGLGYTVDRILADYDLSSGRLMLPGFLFMFFAPLLAARVRAGQHARE